VHRGDASSYGAYGVLSIPERWHNYNEHAGENDYNKDVQTNNNNNNKTLAISIA
jgi:hypothetical protein